MELKDMFSSLLKAVDRLSQIEKEKAIQEAMMETRLAFAKEQVATFETMCANYLRENGLLEEKVEGAVCMYKLSFSRPQKSVEIVDIDAVPDEFVKTERTAKKKEIKDAYKDAKTLPNWLQFKPGKSTFTWKPMKK